MNNRREPSGERPEQFENRDVEGQTGQRKPDGPRLVRDAVVHPGAEVHNVAMLNHHTLGLAGRARRVDDVGQVGGRDGALDALGTLPVNGRSIGVHRDDGCSTGG